MAPGQVTNAPAAAWVYRRSARTRPDHRFEPHYSEGDKPTAR
jgi:hypothetical protein